VSAKLKGGGRLNTAERYEFIRKNYSKMTNSELAEILGLTEGSVTTIACRLGVNKRYDTPDLEDEEWRIHEKFPDFYVSNFGRIKSMDRNKLMFTRVHEKYVDCRINDKDGKKCSPRVHKLVAESFVPNPDNLPVVNHIDGNRMNNRADNLEWVTYKQNAKHAQKLGLVGKASRKINDELAHDICRKLESGMSIREITESNPLYTKAIVEKIRQYHRWKHVSQHYKWN
jgi:hypothetical protein